MKLLFLTLLFIALSEAQYNVNILNTFSADVDIYDRGIMGRGKNACSWHRSVADKQEVFYYLAMQPWRHLVWTIYEGNQWVKYYINEDASAIPAKTKTPKVDNSDSNDYCRKEYATPMDTYDIDWNQIDPESRLEAVDINGITCYKYPAKIPLNHIYLREHYTRQREVLSLTPCRYDFIGGKQITFRSFNSFSEVFITNDAVQGYQLNRTRCIIDPTPNNVDTDFAIVLGIADKTIVQNINNALTALKDFPTLKQTKIYYMGGDSIKVEELTNWDTLKMKSVTAGSVDAIVNTAKNDLIKRVPKSVKRGTMIVLMDSELMSTFDAETAFDRNGITVHTVVYNPEGDNKKTLKARTLLSLGAHYHEFKSQNEISAVINELYVGIRANLTERCDRTKCDGFCDARDRCTCPMCCENTCFFSYCDTTTATCKPWPPAKPKAKITCDKDCVGERECRDLEGCVYTKYNEGCKPTAKCMKAVCDSNDPKAKCKVVSACETDKKPSYQNKCWSYYCDENNGNCMRSKSGNTCPPLKSLCDELVCDEDLTCRSQSKECVKTAPYIEMPCYIARCNKKTGMCENALKCEKYTGCGATADKSRCYCDPKDGKFECKCDTTTEGYCKEGEEVCDSTVEGQDPHCVKSKCPEDLVIEGCRIRRCNEATGENYWENMDCSKKVNFTFVGDMTEEYCKDKYEIYCDEGDCFGRQKIGVSSVAACGRCNFNEDYTVENGVKIYKVEYTEKCSEYYPTCESGKVSTTASKYFTQGSAATCKKVENGDYKCVYPELTASQTYDYCAGCYSNECYKAKGYIGYKYDSKTGMCTQTILNTKPTCSVCNENNDGYIKQCENKDFTQEYTYPYLEKSMTWKYKIPKTCINEQCIPVLDFNCMDRYNEELKPIIGNLSICDAGLTGSYHYSSKFDYDLYFNGEPQSKDFMKEAEAEAYCEYTVKAKPCHYCSIAGLVGEESVKDNDKCAEEQQAFRDKVEKQEYKDKIKFTCDEDTGTCIDESEIKCEKKDCWYTIFDGNDCVNASRTTCQDAIDHIKTVLNNYNSKKDMSVPHIQCAVSEQCYPEEQHVCKVTYSNKTCSDAYQEYLKGAVDFGCRVPNEVCNEDTYHCTFRTITMPEEDASVFTSRDGVKFGDKCYQYECHETRHNDGTFEHHWIQTAASVAATTAEPYSLCDEVSCNPLTGEVVHKERQCTPIEAFKMTEEQAQCFACQCSYIDGEPQIVMLSSTNEETYELDACGNCIVRDRLTGEQKNKHVECILSATVNLTGAIAGATVAASVVFGLIGAMVVVSIGAFQTYQLVSSAMKNVISTTLENPEFVAADNEATNVLAGGD